MKPALRVGIVVAALCVVAMLVWQGVTAHGAPDPTRPNTSPTVAFLDIGILVFREGLECILVLAAITASMTGAKRAHRRPVALGAGLAFVASLITWFIAVRIVGSLSDNMSALDLQAATGFFAELSFTPGWHRCVKRCAAGYRPHSDGSGVDLRPSTASAVSQNADHYWHSPRSRVAGNGRRASAGNAAGALDLHY